MDPEVGAQKAAEKAIASAGKFADEQTKQMMAKKAANMYIKQDSERKKAMDMLEKAINMLGPAREKNKPNKYVSSCIGRIKEVISSAEKKEEANAKDCEALADKIEASLTGVDVYARKMPGGVNPFVLAGPNFEQSGQPPAAAAPPSDTEKIIQALMSDTKASTLKPAEPALTDVEKILSTLITEPKASLPLGTQIPSGEA